MPETATDGPVVAPGNYDGVHIGHRALLAAARELAADGERVSVLTFDPHPAQLLGKGSPPKLLTTIERRRELLLALGADTVDVVRFDEAFAMLTAREFVSRVLIDRLHARGVVVGPDFRYGQGRAGDATTLRTAARTHGFSLRVVAPVERDGAVVSSTRIRATLAEGDVGSAAELLGRLHDATGVVGGGDRRGRTLGFPTANLDCEPVMLPADGVYSVVARAPGGELLRGVANLGVRPTFMAGRSVEVHLLDFDGDLSGAMLRVGFVGRIRSERTFDGPDALRAQITADVGRARRDLERTSEAWTWI